MVCGYCNSSSEIQKHVIKTLANELDKETIWLNANISEWLQLSHSEYTVQNADYIVKTI